MPGLRYRQEGQALPRSCNLRAWLAGWDGPSPSTGSATCPRLGQGCCQQLPRLCWKLGWPPPLGKEVCRWRSCRGCHGPEAPPQRSRRASCTRLGAALCLLAHSWAGLVHGACCSWALHRVGQLCQGSWHSGHMMSLPLSETWSWAHTREAGLGSSAPRAMCMALSKLEQLAAGSAAPHPACAVHTPAPLTGGLTPTVTSAPLSEKPQNECCLPAAGKVALPGRSKPCCCLSLGHGAPC